MKRTNTVLSILAVSVILYSGCESDVIQINYEPEKPAKCEDACEDGMEQCDSNAVMQCRQGEQGCLEWALIEECGTGTHCDDSTLSCEEGCEEVCPTESEMRCNESGLLECKPDAAGCATWKTVGTCPDGTICNAESARCVKECEETCDSATQVRCSPEGIDYCENDIDGCATHHIEACEAGTYCDSSELKCVPCEDACDPNEMMRCTSKGVETCSVDATGCALWTQTETCGAGQSCDAGTLKCVDGCTNACEAGAKKCVKGGVSECRDANKDGCLEWDTPVKCDDGKTCDEATKTCTCGSACTPGETKCEGHYIYTCQNTGMGCAEWAKGDSCGTGETCNSEGTACELSCGNDCEPFSIILIPDTQNYAKVSKGESNIYTRQMKWINQNEIKENIRAAIHLGDITDNNTTKQWEVGDYAHKKYLDTTNIPYSISTGNHDYKGGSGYGRSRTQIGKYFGSKRFAGKEWYHSTPYTGNSYITFSVGNIKFLVLALEFAARKDVICWADELIKKYPDHHVIIETHNYLTKGAGKNKAESLFESHGYTTGAYLPDATHGASGYDLYHELVARHSNVFMAVCGHVGDTEWRQKTAFNNNTVTEMLVDYQFDAPCKESSMSACNNHCQHTTNAGNGWLRQLIFNPKTNTVEAKTITVLGNGEFAAKKPAFYCSELNKNSSKRVYSKDVNNEDHQFSFACDFTTPIEYQYSTGDYLGFTIRNINNNGDGQQLRPAAAMHRTTGTMVTVWEDDSSGGDGKATAGSKKGTNNHDIHGRIFYGGGCEKVKQFTVNANTAGDQMSPVVAADKDGNFVVVWADDNDGNGYYEIMMRGFDETGNERIKTTIVNTKGDGNQRNPSIAMTPDGRFVVAWEDESDSSKTPQIFIRGFDANGKQTFADRNVDKLAGVRQKPTVGIADNGNFVVTWQDDTDMNGKFEIVAKGFNADGTDRIPRFTVNSVPDGQQLNPSIAMNGAGVFAIAYEDDADGNGLYRIKAVGYNEDGSKLFSDKYISDAGENAVQPALCVMKNNDIVYSWTAKALNSGDIRLRSYKSGTLREKTFTVNSITKGIQDQPAIGCTETGKYAILWHDDLDGNGYYEIFGHGYNEM
ncbi:MAG: metallophosphoesterase [Proteobacteria bacterium]|nr:metallophosphoesterase [Pseudomonadota bacterium]